MKHSFWICCFCFLINCANAQGQTEKRTILYSVIDSFRRQLRIPGISATLIDGNGEITDLAIGYSDTATRELLTPQHKMLSGSTGKMYFAISILQLAQQNQIRLDDPVARYLGKYQWFSHIPNSSIVTIRQLLQHTGGIQEYYDRGDFMSRLKNEPDKVWKPDELLSYVFELKPLFPPGSSFSYADTDYILLAMVIEEVTKQKAYDYIQEHVILPAGIKNTVPSISRKIPALANGYSTLRLPSKIDGPLIREGQLIINPQFEWGGGGFASCSHDLAVLVYALMHDKFINEKYLQEMKKEVEAKELGPQNYYGLGLQIIKSSLGWAYGHSGWFPGYESDVEYLPDYNICVAVQVNTDHSDAGFLHPRNAVFAIIKKYLKTLQSSESPPVQGDFYGSAAGPLHFWIAGHQGMTYKK